MTKLSENIIVPDKMETNIQFSDNESEITKEKLEGTRSKGGKKQDLLTMLVKVIRKSTNR